MVARRSALLAAILAAALLPATSTASSGYSTKVIVSLRVPAFHGSLKSKKDACTKGRTVNLYRQKPGRDRLLGTDKSNVNAKWSIPIGKKLPSGASYYAKAPAKGNCKPAKSKVLSIG